MSARRAPVVHQSITNAQHNLAEVRETVARMQVLDDGDARVVHSLGQLASAVDRLASAVDDLARDHYETSYPDTTP